MSFPIDAVRAQFKALSQPMDRVYFDAPGGTQVCTLAVARMVLHLASGTANSGGAFRTSAETDALSDDAHAAMADLLGGRPEEIAFGQNMTSLTLAVSRALARTWEAGDEIILTRLDHDANVAPWLLAARDAGVTVRWLDFDPEAGRWDPDDLPALLGPRTRLVALGMASNALGTINPVADAIRIVRANSPALVYVDAVQSVPHIVTDVAALDADFLACSPYKFFGPHQGVLWAKSSTVEGIEAYKVRPAGNRGAHRFESGTPSFEGQAGVLGTVEYLEWLGREADPQANSRRAALIAAMEAATVYEQELGTRLIEGLASIPGLKLYGPPTMEDRVPTFSFTIEGHHPDAIAQHLAGQEIYAWSGHFYAVEVLDRLGLADKGGLLRIGLCHYSTAGEVDRLIAALKQLG
ncbi:cysteine desulfurase-like protein [Sphingomonas sp. AOB5]|uniref:cysteine desulfurase-like protein n=1 Tax=Sphingomonas sp. AOB5 TaxID=3034017 RepID=UPI0023F63978|nr:cysteine desulfurase-like protein [Sphingomonas sp. AOB5]MDF7775636.1 cysteine desulfurase-like protein [Sphingomonas sp. AOB5]